MTRQRGVVLVLTLAILIGVSMVALAAARSAIVASQSARHHHAHATAYAAAQAALMDAELEIRRGSRDEVLLKTAPNAALWLQHDLTDERTTVAYGTFTSRVMPTGQGTLTARPPRYLIEVLPSGTAGEDASIPAAPEYRITAIGLGPDPRIIAVVQSTYRQEPP